MRNSEVFEIEAPIVFFKPVKKVFNFQAKCVKRANTREAYQLKRDSHKDCGAASKGFTCYRSKKLPNEWLKFPPLAC